MTFITDTLPFIPARFFTDTNGRAIRVIVVHDMESPETVHTAEDVGNWWHGPTSSQASAHVGVDSDSAVRYVQDNDVAWHAPGCNADGLGIEHAGAARQTHDQWLDDFGKAMLAISAKVVAAWCAKYGIPAKRLSQAELAAGESGIVGHVDVSAVYHRSDHTDPGSNFPWDYYMELVAKEYAALEAPKPVNPVPAPAPRPTPAPQPRPVDNQTAALQHAVHLTADNKWGPITDVALRTVRTGPHKPVDIRALQHYVGTPVDGIWGPHSQAAYIETVKAIQSALRVTADGAWGPITDRAFFAARFAHYLHY